MSLIGPVQALDCFSRSVSICIFRTTPHAVDFATASPSGANAI
jgi:hypothetical protein